MKKNIFYFIFLVFFILKINLVNADNYNCDYVNKEIKNYSKIQNKVDNIFDNFWKKTTKEQKKIYKRILKITNRINKKTQKKVKFKEYVIFGYIACINKEKLNQNFYNYILNYKEEWIKFYTDEEKNLAILDLDLNYIKIKFWGVDENLDTDSVLTRFFRHRPYEFTQIMDKDFKEKNKIFAFVNGQFFNPKNNPTSLSFPLKSEWKIINNYIDNKITKKTFVIDKDNNAKIFFWYNEKYLKNENNKEVIVAFTPNLSARWDDAIWRTYVWLKSEKHVIFFIARNKTQTQMNSILYKYWIKQKNIIMMDWWASSQFAFSKDWNFFKQYFWRYGLPQVFVIYKNK